MPRPPKCRLVETWPQVTYFKPRGVPLSELEEVRLTLEGFEALRLTELEGLDQDQAATRMGVSRQTFGRVLSAARQSLAQAVVDGKALRIEGGHYRLQEEAEERRTKTK